MTTQVLLKLKSAHLLIFTTVLLSGLQAKAQLTMGASQPIQCFAGPVTTSSSIQVLTSPPATSYSWANSFAAPGCTPNITVISSSGSLVAVHYPCCGVYTLICSAYNGVSLVTSSVITTTVVCPPPISITPPTTICAGSSQVLSASGILTYSWGTGPAGNSTINVSPAAYTIYTVTGINAFGCTNSATTSVNIYPVVTLNFITTTGPNGLINFNNTSTGGVFYLWNFGNGATSTATSPAFTFTSNGVHTVTLSGTNAGGCTTTTTVPVFVSNVIIPCVASFNFTVTPGGQANFVSTSTNTNGATTFSWTFGNGGNYVANGVAGQTAYTTYTSSGTYSATLVIFNAATSCSSSTTTVFVFNICNVSPSFTSQQTNTSTVSFTSTSTGTIAGTVYSWAYGDGTFGLGLTTAHNYSGTGAYSVTLTTINNGSCTASHSGTVVIKACTLSAGFTHTVGLSGSVAFGNASINSSVNTQNYWDFGDGVFSTAFSPTHVYSNAGTYYVSLKVHDSLGGFCRDSITQSVNVTNIPCVAYSNFTVLPTNTPQYWNAIPSYPWNIIAAFWSWGDGTQSNTLYTSHVYSVAASYSICLSVTVSCGSSSTYCFPYYFNKSAGDESLVLNINVIPPGMLNGIGDIPAEELSYQVYPNPNTGAFHLNLEALNGKDASVRVYNLLGETVYSSELPFENEHPLVNLGNITRGVYFVEVSSGSGRAIKKIVVND